MNFNRELRLKRLSFLLSVLNISLIALLLVENVNAQDINFSKDECIIENSILKKHFSYSESGAGSIEISSLYSKEAGNELLSEKGKPYFEFVVGKKLITANDKVWQYKSYEIRQMLNGGKELKLVFKGQKNPVEGLEVVIYQQVFPNTSVIREQIELKAAKGMSYPLNKLDNELHFEFPQYSLKSTGKAEAKEIRIAIWVGELIDIDENATYDDRFLRRKSDHNLANNHMFHPKIIDYIIFGGKELTTKGPLNIVSTGTVNFFTAYEHASQDGAKGVIDDDISGDLVVDGLQGVKGVFNLKKSDSDFDFLGINQQCEDNRLNVSVKILRGGYLDGELVDEAHPYKSVWTASAFYHDGGFEKGKEIIRDYLWKYICEKPASRKPFFYYNSWGMQRGLERKGNDVRGVFTQEKIIEEIEYADQFGVDIFVLDDGWEKAQGEWVPNPERLPEGLAPIKEELDRRGMRMGLWFSPMGIDENADRYKEHPEWVILDSEGNPIKAQWNHPAFDFVSGFYDLFVEDCKKLIDQGARFFKFDAINTFFSTLPNLDHGSDLYPPEEIRARYEYLLPIYVTSAMKELTDYEPDLIIEMDLTEGRRCMVGLAPLSQGLYFWMNNGASSYEDYTTYRTKSMRTIPNQFAGIVPLGLFTYSDYPHNSDNAQRYNVNTSLVSGHGFWGALEFMREGERLRVGNLVKKAKRVSGYITEVNPSVTGKVGSSPEIYTMVNSMETSGQVIAFSGSALNYEHNVKITPEKLLAVLNHSYSMNNEELTFNFDFPMPDATREAFIIPNENRGISVVSSTAWLDDVTLDSDGLEYVSGGAGEQVVKWNKDNGKPQIADSEYLTANVTEKDNFYIIKVNVNKAGSVVRIGLMK